MVEYSSEGEKYTTSLAKSKVKISGIHRKIRENTACFPDKSRQLMKYSRDRVRISRWFCDNDQGQQLPAAGPDSAYVRKGRRKEKAYLSP